MTIICVDDHPIMLKGLEKNIQEMFPNAIVAASSGADEAMELRMPSMSAPRTALRRTAMRPFTDSVR